MAQRFRRILARLALGVVAATAGLAVGASPAQAFGGETFGCRVSPGTILTWSTNCHNNKPASVYNAGFNVNNLSGTGYTFSWSYTGPVLYVVSGCTSTASGCGLAVANSDAVISVTVTYTQNGQSATKTSNAFIIQYCGNVYC
ncbi:hypothetical protein AB0J72_16975 [Dactylosporangium sp. NPDC049742]|uniref:hypothetical protein n=1 Tax=Dactylosporangium sp. NPDC049742 TaxID=3154737 RepID=UPI003437BC06